MASGGSVSGTEVMAGGSLIVSSGGSATGTVVSGTMAVMVGSNLGAVSATETIDYGASVSGASVGSGGYLSVSGTAHGGFVSSGGSLDVAGYLGSSLALGVTVYSGGVIEAGTPTAIVSGTILSGGTAVVAASYYGDPSGQLIDTFVLSGGVLSVGQYGVAGASIISSGGYEDVSFGGHADGPVIAGGTLELGYTGFNIPDEDTSPGFALSATFSGSGGTLKIDGPDMPTQPISGFEATDRIILAEVPADPDASVSVSGDTVTVSAGGQTYTLDIVGASSIPFTVANGPAAAGDIVIACYCTGTAIRTPLGEVPVETIVPGDRVITADGRTEPVVWVGRRSYAGRFLAGQPHLLPVRFKAGSLGDGLPRRDLLVSPCHAMLLDGVLVQAGALTNGSTIVQERAADRVDYVHIELARHDVILAEGAPGETYLDDDNRMVFANAAEFRGMGATGGYCAPRVADGYELEAIRQRLVPAVFRAA